MSSSLKSRHNLEITRLRFVKLKVSLDKLQHGILNYLEISYL
jgi:hypothetical protein